MYRKLRDLGIARKNGGSLECVIRMYFDLLLDKALGIFECEGIANSLFHEVERRLILGGKCGFIPAKELYTPVWITEFGPTVFYDRFTSANFFTPISSGEFTQSNKKEMGSGVVMYNDYTHTGLFELILHTATLLAHIDISIRNVAINLREPPLVPAVSSNNFFDTVNEYRKAIFKGNFKPIRDMGFATVRMVENKSIPSGYLKDLYELRKNIMNDYYNLLGFKTSFEKKGNMIVEEVAANEEMLQLNFGSMLECRREGYAILDNLYGTHTVVRRRQNEL